MGDGDGDFSKATKDLLAKKAGHTCSNPNCNAPTSGAALTDALKAVNQGKAAHIIASATNGPRGDASVSDEQRRDESNGVWLCAACADLVDKNGGVDYPKETLRKWKADREAASGANVGRPATTTVVDGTHEAHGTSNVTGLEILVPARIQPGTRAIATGVHGVTGTRIGATPAQAAPPPGGPGGVSARVAASFGVLCRACGFQAGAYGSGAGSTACPKCGGVLVANPNAAPVFANASCPCGWSAGLAAGLANCPACSRPL